MEPGVDIDDWLCVALWFWKQRRSALASLTAMFICSIAVGQQVNAPQTPTAVVQLNSHECPTVPVYKPADDVAALLQKWRSEHRQSIAPHIVFPEPPPNLPDGLGAIQGSGGLDGKPVERIDPVYPNEAKDRGIIGSVMLNVHVGRDGKVKKVSVECGNSMLAPSAIEAVQRWVYRPILINDSPVEFIIEVKLTFPPSSEK